MRYDRSRLSYHSTIPVTRGNRGIPIVRLSSPARKSDVGNNWGRNLFFFPDGHSESDPPHFLAHPDSSSPEIV